MVPSGGAAFAVRPPEVRREFDLRSKSTPIPRPSLTWFQLFPRSKSRNASVTILNRLSVRTPFWWWRRWFRGSLLLINTLKGRLTSVIMVVVFPQTKLSSRLPTELSSHPGWFTLMLNFISAFRLIPWLLRCRQNWVILPRARTRFMAVILFMDSLLTRWASGLRRRSTVPVVKLSSLIPTLPAFQFQSTGLSRLLVVIWFTSVLLTPKFLELPLMRRACTLRLTLSIPWVQRL